jgi:hypothetical protein
MVSIKKVIYFLIIGFVLLSVIQYLINFGVQHCKKDQIGKVNQIMGHQINPQIICFGSSVGEVGFNSRIVSEKLKKSVFNCSIDGTSYIQYKGLIEEYANYANANELIVFMESYFTFQNPKQVSSLERYIAHLEHRNLYQSLANQQPDLLWKCKYVPFYQFIPVTHVYYRNSIKGWISYLRGTNEIDTLRGQTPVYRSWEADQDEFLKSGKSFTIALDEEVINTYINDLLTLKKQGKKVVIVLPPVFKGLEENKITDFKPIRSKFKMVSAQTGIPFLDFTESEISNSKEYFYNSNHLNSVGADIFSAALSDSLILNRIVN